MATGTAGDSARLFAWQMTHYIVRGGANDPVLPATGGPPVTTGGTCGFASKITVAAPPGSSAAPITMNVNSTVAATSGATITGLVSPNAGIYLGTIPQGAWITSVQLQIVTAFSGGTNDTVGVYMQPANQAYGGATVNLLFNMTTVTAGLSGLPSPGTAVTTAPGLGASTGAAGTIGATDLDLYFLTWKAGGTGTAFTAGQAIVCIEFTGLEG